MTQITVPSVRIWLDDTALDANIMKQIVSLRVRRAFSAPTVADIEMDGGNITAPAIGASMRIEVGGRPDPLFQGTLSAMERTRRLDGKVTFRLRAFDKLQALRHSGRAAHYSQVTPAQLVEDVASRFDMSVQADQTGPNLDHLVRTDRSDFDFILNETRRFGLWFHLRNNMMHLHGLEGIGSNRQITLADTAFEARVEVNANDSTGAISFTAFAPDVIEPFSGFAFGLDNADAYGQSSTDADAELPIFNLATCNEDEALCLATAEMTHRDASRVVLRAIFDGSHIFQLGERLDVTDLGFDTAGPMVISQIEERIDAVSGHIVEISTCPPPLCADRQQPKFAWATVLDNDDPANTGRVRCSLPTHGDAETAWLQVLRPMAGAGRGFAYVPAIGDQVMILSNTNRLEHGFVIGAMNAQDTLAVQNGAGDAKRFGFYSVAGHALSFDDDSKEAKLKAPDGSSCTLGPDGIALSAKGDLTLEAPGGTVTIRGAAIDLERG
ncbi:phage baseplate assembly protein V [Parasulfitobacter algicola]|uniref:Gp5/Type VI secretion system Vgr protein OB-fold domain-containing protein n=1 Tax=Parasulfitobacter algicola TaxID=2614809 RepID=A0ABX2IS75_9RHOB|nr:phage baseplate assembly protein V [Sulfitobacter algicola]NSX55757.1 hypothetical protein [Sulfitobacter algicola]